MGQSLSRFSSFGLRQAGTARSMVSPGEKGHITRLLRHSIMERSPDRAITGVNQRLESIMPMWINHQQGVDYLNSIQDSTVRALMEYAYSQIYIHNLTPDCDFDVLFFYKVLAVFLHDKEKLANALLSKVDYGSLIGEDGW